MRRGYVEGFGPVLLMGSVRLVNKTYRWVRHEENGVIVRVRIETVYVKNGDQYVKETR